MSTCAPPVGGQRRRFPAGAYLFRPGMAAELYLWVEGGTARVRLLSETGHELTLYRLHPGESCVLTTSCLLAGDTYPAEGLAETELLVSCWSRQRFQGLFAESEPFRNAVLRNYAARLTDLLGIVSRLAFEGLDRRLAELLLARMGQANRLATTHADLAAELGVHRETVSRRLKRLERYGLLRLGRNTIDVLDRARLAGLARRVSAITDADEPEGTG